MEVSGENHKPVALTARKALSLPTELEAVWTPEPELTVRRYGHNYKQKYIIADVDPLWEPAYY
jgi:hypothetical protein